MVFPNHAQPLVTAPAETAVLALLLAESPLSRVELARRTGLSSTAVTKAARRDRERAVATNGDERNRLDAERTPGTQVPSAHANGRSD